MPQQIDAKEVKKNIINYIKEHGPSLPVAVAKRVGLNSIFTSAFLSEIASDGLIKISSMKVGGSPLYYSPETYAQLERFISYLNSKEREACELLKKSGIIQDDLQHPAIRVALRGLKDFAIPFKKNDKILFKYFTYVEPVMPQAPEIKEEPKPIEQPKVEQPVIEQPKIELKQEPLKKTETQISITGEPILNVKELKHKVKKPKVKKEKSNPEKYLNEIKAFLESKNASIIKVESFDRRNVIARVKIGMTECLLFAFDKKKISEKEMIKAWKKASAMSLPHYIITREDPSKKMKETIDACRNLFGSDKLPPSPAQQEHSNL
jgi:hypothetical protein